MEGEFYGELIGDPTAADHYYETQTQPEDCVEESIADIVGQETGHEPSESQIDTLAAHTPSTLSVNPVTGQPEPAYSQSTGTDLQDAPELLAHYHVSAQYADDTTATASGAPATGMDVLEHDLAAGDKVIAGVDGPQIWNAIGDGPAVDNGHPDHAVDVTGVDTTKGIVYLNDSGVPHGGDEAVPIATFEQSWATSDDAMVVAQPAGGDHSDTTLTTDTTPLPSPSPIDPHLVDPIPSEHDLAEKASVIGTVATAGATVGYWAYRRQTRHSKAPKPPTS